MEIVAFTRNLLIGKLFLFCVFVSILCQRNVPDDQAFNNRQWSIGPTARFLSLFTVYQWNSGLCVATSGEYGNCVSEDVCISKRGILGGPCAAGFGICCVFMASCGEVATENGTYFVNPNHPNAFEDTGSCQLTVMKSNPNICQYRIDLEHFSISGPEPLNHVCNTDQFLVSGGSPTPTICGTSHGEHMYIDAGLGQSNPIVLTLITSGAPFPRKWRIRISQIQCDALIRADAGCLQYYTGVYGRVRSFNFDPAVGGQLSNQDYSICIRTERNFCSIQYTACQYSSEYLQHLTAVGNSLTNNATVFSYEDFNRSRSFTLSGNSNMPVNSMVGAGSQGTPNACINDWLLIGCARVADRLPQTNICEDRICGGTFNAEISSMEKTITSSVRPFRLAFHTDPVEAPTDIDNRGFCLDFVQQPCTNG